MTSGSRRSADRGRSAPTPLLSEAALAAIERHLGDRERRRDELAERARHLRRAAQGAMGRLHDRQEVGREMAALGRETRELQAWVHRSAAADAGLAHDALQESVEAQLLFALDRDAPLPTPKALGVEPETYLSGLGDVVGEVRRLVLHDLSEGRIPRAETRLRLLEELYRILRRFETTRAILPLKPKQDTARSLLERTRGEVTMARMLDRARLPSSGREERP